MEPNILLIDDDEKIMEIVKGNIGELGLGLIWAADGEQGLELARADNYSLILLDCMLPGIGGTEICRRLREEKILAPIIMITAKGEELDRVLGLELGADDYLTKPFSVPELLARIRAVLRRQKWDGQSHRSSADGTVGHLLSETITKKDLTVNFARRKVLLKGELLKLSAMEFDLLAFFITQPGKAFSRGELLQEIWGSDLENYESNINSSINRLRRKIEPDLNDPTYIKTVWGHGYRFAEDEELVS